MRPPQAAGTVSPRELGLVLLVLAPLGVLFTAIPPIAQDPGYHALADQRALFGVPNFLNIVSNAGFLLVGWLGLRLCLGKGVEGASRSWTMFFFGTLLVAAGSAYYHWEPGNEMLAWDRLPMTVTFMALFAALLAEHLRPEIERPLLRAAIIVGIVSVGWWHYADDLRMYVWVQLAPFLAIVYVLIAYPAPYSRRWSLGVGFALYAAAKMAEFGDAAILSATSGLVGGHSVKHLLGAAAVYCVYLMLHGRRPLAA